MTEQKTSRPEEQRLCRCGRPAATEPGEATMCREHRGLWDANAELEAWEMAYGVLEPWYATTTPIGLEKLMEAMDRAMDYADERLKAARAEKERAEASLGCAL
jgi:hypothetical protein